MYLGLISDTTNRFSFESLVIHRGKRTGTFWAIFMAGNICGNLCAYVILKYIGLVHVAKFLLCSLKSSLGGMVPSASCS